MSFPPLSRLHLTGIIATLCLSLSAHAMAAPLLYETFEGLTNGQISGQSSWILGSGGDAALSQVVEDTDVAYSSPKFLSLVGSNGISANVLYALPSPPTLTDTTHNHLQFFFRADNAQDGSKTELYFNLHGNAGAGRIIEAYIDFTNSRIYLTTNAAPGSYNTRIDLGDALAAGMWYQLDAVLTPSDHTLALSITDTSSSTTLMSGEYAFQNTSLEYNHLHAIQFMTNANGRLDWQIDNLLIFDPIPEPSAMALLLPLAVGSIAFRCYRKR